MVKMECKRSPFSAEQHELSSGKRRLPRLGYWAAKCFQAFCLQQHRLLSLPTSLNN